MAGFHSISIRYKILLVVGVALLGFIINLGFNYIVTNSNAMRLDQVRDVYFPTLQNIDANRVRLDKIRETLKAAVNVQDEDLVEEEADALAKDMHAGFSKVAELAPELAGEVKKLDAGFTAYYDSARAFTLGMIEGSIAPTAIKPAVDKMMGSMKAFSGQLEGFRSASYDRFVDTLAAANSASQFALYSGIVISLLAVAIVAGLGYLISGLIVKNILAVVSSLREMANGEGDLTRRLEARGDDEIGALVNYFNRFIEKLQNIISNVAGSTTQLAAAAEELSLVSGESNDSVTRQAAETEKVAAAMNQMTATVQEVANHAQEAANSAQNASASAGSGQGIVEQTMSSINSLASEVEQAAGVIHKLEQDSENIGGVLDVIRGISEQTNLLALNAAIEAARAGEQGRGFAVVADEVRTLAGRTQESTKEIQTMIESLQSGAAQAVAVMTEGQEKAQGSVDQAARAGESLREINNAIASIRDMNTQIASAAEEQGSVAEEINRNINTISEIGMQTSQGAQQTATASEEMSRLATRLQAEVGQFKV